MKKKIVRKLLVKCSKTIVNEGVQLCAVDRLDSLIVGVRRLKEVREGDKGKKGVGVKTGREGIRSLVSCAGG
jgi:hypothetical protein